MYFSSTPPTSDPYIPIKKFRQSCEVEDCFPELMPRPRLAQSGISRCAFWDPAITALPVCSYLYTLSAFLELFSQYSCFLKASLDLHGSCTLKLVFP